LRIAAIARDLIETPGRDGHCQLVRLIVAESQLDSVHSEKRDGRCKREALVTVDQSMIAGDRVVSGPGAA
jgi:hypothetical protein